MSFFNKFKTLLTQGVESVKGAYQNVSEKVSDTYQDVTNKVNKEKNKELLLNLIQKNIEDHSLSASDIQEIEQARQEWDISDSEMSEIKLKAFKFAMNKAKHDIVIHSREIDLLNQLEQHFQFNTQEYDAIKAELTRIKNIYSIQQGKFVTFDAPELSLDASERCLWIENAEYVEFTNDTPFIPKPPKRFDAQTSYIFGETKGIVFPIQNNQVIAKGKLYITTQKVVFLTNDKDYTIKHKNINYFEPFANGLMIYADKEPDKFKYEYTRNAEIIAFILQNVLKMAKEQ
ncbi:MAG: hypothetical protein NZ455_05610 [Bacteroidia bacterium]|nr:hypothetical protein [Bacteroidia bacterium]MDW8346275.1 hypothetical protein [Bacteroidia bacterium]